MDKYSDDLSYDDDDDMDDEEIPSPPRDRYYAKDALDLAKQCALKNAKAYAEWYENRPALMRPTLPRDIWTKAFLESLATQGFAITEATRGPQGPQGAAGFNGKDGKDGKDGTVHLAPIGTSAEDFITPARLRQPPASNWADPGEHSLPSGSGASYSNWRPTLRYLAGEQVLYNGFLWRATNSNRANIDPPGENSSWTKA